MNREKMKKFLDAQREEIERYKWIESEKAGRDLGEAAARDWVAKYAKVFREEYERKNGQQF